MEMSSCQSRDEKPDDSYLQSVHIRALSHSTQKHPVNRNPNLKYFLKASMCTGFNVSTQGCCCDMGVEDVNFWMADIDAYVPLILQVLAFKDQTQALRSQTKVAGQLAIFVHILEKGGGNLGK